MYNGIGLQTARGSGTNGYVQTNKFFVRAKTSKVMTDNKGFALDQGLAGISKKPNREILEHDRKRQIELQLVVLEDTLTEQGYTDAEIAEKLEETRRTLEAADAAAHAASDAGALPVFLSDKKISDTQTHQIAARKEKKMENFRAALGLDEEGKLPDEIVDERGKKKNSSDDEHTEHEEGEIVATAAESKRTKPRKRSVKDVKVDKHDGGSRKGRDKKKRHDQFSSDAELDLKDATESESDSDTAKRKRRSLKRSRKSRSDSSSSSSDDDSDRPIKKARKRSGGRRKKHVQNRKGGGRKKRRAYESSDADSGSSHTSASESDSSVEDKHKRKLPEQSKKIKNEDSERFGSDSDKGCQRKRGGKRPDVPRRHESDVESDRKDPLNRRMDKYAEAHLSRDTDNSDSGEGNQKRRGADRYLAGHKRNDYHGGYLSTRNDENADARKMHDSDDEPDEYDRRNHRKASVKQHERKSVDDSDEDERYSGMRSSRGQKTEPDYSEKISDDSRYHGSREVRDMRNEEHARRRHDGADERGYKLHWEDYVQMDKSRKRSRKEETGRRMYERDAVSSKRSRHDDCSYNGERRNEGSRHRDDRRRK